MDNKIGFLTTTSSVITIEPAKKYAIEKIVGLLNSGKAFITGSQDDEICILNKDNDWEECIAIITDIEHESSKTFNFYIKTE